MLDFFTRTCIDGFKKTVPVSTGYLKNRPNIDRFKKLVDVKTGFLNPSMQERVFVNLSCWEQVCLTRHSKYGFIQPVWSTNLFI